MKKRLIFVFVFGFLMVVFGKITNVQAVDLPNIDSISSVSYGASVDIAGSNFGDSYGRIYTKGSAGGSPTGRQFSSSDGSWSNLSIHINNISNFMSPGWARLYLAVERGGYISLFKDVDILTSASTPTPTPTASPNPCGGSGESCCGTGPGSSRTCNTGFVCDTSSNTCFEVVTLPTIPAIIFTPTPTVVATATPIATPGCGSHTDEVCCNGKCTTSLDLYCVPPSLGRANPYCSDFHSFVVSFDEWQGALRSYNYLYDFNNDNRIDGIDYVLWLMAEGEYP